VQLIKASVYLIISKGLMEFLNFCKSIKR